MCMQGAKDNTGITVFYLMTRYCKLTKYYILDFVEGRMSWHIETPLATYSYNSTYNSIWKFVQVA